MTSKKPVAPPVLALSDDDAELFARARSVNLPVPLVRLLRAFERSLPSRAKYAVGGGIAVAVHGYRRLTDDLDVFASPPAARRIATALRGAGLTVESIGDAHVIAYFPDDNAAPVARREWPEHRIDILFTVTEPEATAIRTARRAEYAGAAFAVMRADVLAAMKFLAGRPQDLADVSELLQGGTIDVAKARYRVAVSEGDRKAAAFDQMVRKVGRLKERAGRYVQRSEMSAAFEQRRPFV